jgi:hypothetical protein
MLATLKAMQHVRKGIELFGKQQGFDSPRFVYSMPIWMSAAMNDEVCVGLNERLSCALLAPMPAGLNERVSRSLSQRDRTWCHGSKPSF